MAKSNSSSEAVVNDLLAERNKYQTWIARLDSTKDTTPAAVRAKVLSDYQAKLEGVLARLAEHGDAVREQLEQRKVRKEELLAEESKAKETLAEAELRHAVGEYDEGDWVKVRAESNKILVGAREELSKVIEDIERLAEVAKLIATPVAVEPPPPPPPPAPEPPKAAPAPTPAAAETPAPPKRDSGRAEFVPSAAKAKPPADELEFLRSTVGEAEAEPAPPTKSVRGEKERKQKHAEPAPAAVAEESGEPLPKPQRSSENRTLKCPECGTMNRATEWYCERCGSELAGV
ncbi:MAG TPA: Ran-binding zinc finger domain-containing protein [Gemmatimonadales bacterium]|nr:Ran-binding zinc finger domain-containing protein [Gemmatimonadales bacterium]